MTNLQLKLIQQLDKLLPQTQCGLCGHREGCLPYATAIVTDNEPANKCVPGGQPVADAMATVLKRTLLPVVASKWSLDPNSKRPTEVRAYIDENECIGCTKCIPACPVDAIIGSGKAMHSIFTDLCTGCELCLPPCPVDCISLQTIQPRHLTESQRQTEQQQLKQRYQAHVTRLSEQVNDNSNATPTLSMQQSQLNQNLPTAIGEDEAKIAIAAAKLRNQLKRLDKQLANRPNAAKQAQRNQLQEELKQLLAC